ncbi:RTA1 like protein-domain-containing protein [Xylariaceae sp. FL0662B]|nr:RTA1 like protein-domain-containing protein [Xylariaceae sp. FL0662B]
MASSADCTSSGCSRVFLTYQPSPAGNAVLLALFATLIPLAFGLGIKYKSYAFSTAIATGLALEVMGYIGRLLAHNHPNDRNDFVVFLVGTLIGPNFICAATFPVMPRIVALYGDEFRTWRPVWFPYMFYAMTALSFVLELAGGIISTVQDERYIIDTGSRVVSVGLAVQSAALAIFGGHATLFFIAIRARPHALGAKFATLYNSTAFKIFLAVFSLSNMLLAIRTAYRVIAIAEGFGSSLEQNETLFLVLDGAMVLIATVILLAFYPSRIFGQSWLQTAPHRLSQSPPPPIRPYPLELPPAQQSHTYNQINLKSAATNNHSPRHSPRKSQYPVPPQRNMVDSDALW